MDSLLLLCVRGDGQGDVSEEGNAYVPSVLMERDIRCRRASLAKAQVLKFNGNKEKLTKLGYSVLLFAIQHDVLALGGIYTGNSEIGKNQDELSGHRWQHIVNFYLCWYRMNGIVALTS